MRTKLPNKRFVVRMTVDLYEDEIVFIQNRPCESTAKIFKVEESEHRIANNLVHIGILDVDIPARGYRYTMKGRQLSKQIEEGDHGKDID